MAKDVDVLSRFATANDEAVGYINRVDTATSKFRKSKRKGSIVKAAQGNLFEFPVFVSNTIPMDYATATVSLLEQVYATYLQMAISINPVIDADSVKRGMQFADYKTNTNKYLEYTDTTYQHDVCHAEYINEDCKVEFDLLSIEDKDAKVINEAYDYEPMSEFSHYFQEAPINDLVPQYPLPVLDNNGNPEIPWRFQTDANGDIQYGTRQQLFNMLNGHQVDVGNGPENAFMTYMNYTTDHRLEGPSAHDARTIDMSHPVARTQAFNQIASGIDNLAKAPGDIANSIQTIATTGDRIKQAKAKTKVDQWKADNLSLEKTKSLQSVKTTNISYVNDKLCEKMNTMKPLLMKVTLNMLNKDDSLQPIEYVVGVKCHTRMVQSSILPEVAKYPLKEMDKISRKVKWRAGELKFLKDLVFRIKEKKQTAADSRDPNRKWYRRLYELAHMKGDAPAAAVVQGKSLFKVFIKDKQGKGDLQNGMIPNASIIMTQTDVDNIKAQTDIDLLKPSAAKKFCGELFLMSLIIIDTDRESIKILLPDMNSDYDVHSLAAVNKQLATLDTVGTKTRDVFKMLGA